MTQRCVQLDRLPPVISEWQQETYEPDCRFYCHADCGNKIRLTGGHCPFEGNELPIRLVQDEESAVD